jgi:translation elongation factor EF-1alpha
LWTGVFLVTNQGRNSSQIIEGAVIFSSLKTTSWSHHIMNEQTMCEIEQAVLCIYNHALDAGTRHNANQYLDQVVVGGSNRLQLIRTP